MTDTATPSTEGASPAAPVAPVTEPVQNQQEPSAEPANDTTESEQGGPKRQHWAHKRIDELTAEKYEARRERDYWRDVAMRGNQPASTPPAAPVVEQPPTPEQFNNDPAAYLRALAKHEAQQLVKAERDAAEQARQQQEAHEMAMSFAKRAAEVAQKYPDFHEVVQNPALPVSQPMAEAIRRLENGPDVAYHLGRNPEEAARLSRLDPYSAAAEIGRISARLANPPVPVTKAPPPPPTVSGGQALTKSLDQMSMAEYVAARNAQLRSRK